MNKLETNSKNVGKLREIKNFCDNTIQKEPSRNVKKRISFFLKLMLPVMIIPFTVPYIYTSQTLAPKNMAVYNKYIKFLKDHDEHKIFELNEFGWLHTKKTLTL